MKRLVASAVIAMFVAALWATSASALNGPKVFSVLEVRSFEQPMGSFTFEQPPVGGDQFAFRDTLHRWSGATQGGRIGHLQGVGTFVTGFGPRFTKRAVVHFTVQAYLPGGTVMVEGYGRVNPRGPSKYTFPVVGGTGIYANARGQVNVRDIGNGDTNKTNVTFHLLP
jgi:hypothetical protein